MEKIQIKSIIIFFTSLLFLTSCSTTIKTPKYESPDVEVDSDDISNTLLSEISDIPIPSKSIIDLEKTLYSEKEMIGWEDCH